MEKPWFASYPAGVPHDINPDEYRSLIDFFDRHLNENADREAFSNFGQSLSYGELYTLSGYFAAYLQHCLGLERGDRVAIMMPNLLQYTVALMGILRAGMVVVNVNPLYTAPEVVHQLQDAGAKVVVVVANFAATMAEALPQLPLLDHIIVTELGDMLGRFRGAFFNFALKHIKKMVPPWEIPDAIPFKTVLTEGALQPVSTVEIQPEDVAFLQYTGGTTGLAKGAILTHRNMVANVLQCSAWVSSIINRDDIVVAALPMYHIFSLTVCCLTFILLGAHCLLVTNPKDMKRFIKIMKTNKISVFIGVNTLFNGLLHEPEFTELDFSALKLTVAGGMAMQSSVAEQWHKVTGNHITEGYGLTEASPVVTINPVSNTYFTGAIGLPIPSTDVRIRDDEQRDLPLGEVGELWVKGPQVMRGYWQQPAETTNVIDAEGWLSTGDIARIDAQGYITIVDRKKDMILVSGFNVYPNEVEEVIASCPGVNEVAVIGLPSEQTGEMIKAFVVKEDPALTKKDILSFCKRNLTRYKLPKQIEFRESLPKTTVGKVLRRTLKANALTLPGVTPK